MRARLEARASDPTAPERAAAELTASLLATLPRRRAITIALVGLGPHAGLVATPWVLTGLLSQLIERERTPVSVLLLGDATSGEMALRRAASRVAGERACYELPSRDRNVVLRPAAERGESARIPREIVGTSLLVIAPLLHRRASAGGREAWLGPLAGALGGFARSCGLARAGKPEPERLVAAGHRLIGEVFCGAAMLLDATWAGIAEPEAEPSSDAMLRKLAGKSSEPPALALSSELVAPEQVLALADLARLSLPVLLGVDHWLAHLLGLGVRVGARFEGPTPDVEGTLDRWPHLLAGPRAPEHGLAGRAITGLRTQIQKESAKAKAKVGALIGASPRAALPARVPGRFASEWTRRWYGEERR
ncbi:hypothetical protein ACNOYE_15670 [Nannocystaceae bacterium ST9]